MISLRGLESAWFQTTLTRKISADSEAPRELGALTRSHASADVCHNNIRTHTPKQSKKMSAQFVSQTWEVPKLAELRFNAPRDGLVRLTLLQGTAEIFGAELLPSEKEKGAPREYMFGDQSVAVYTYYGCTVLLEGEVDGAYLAARTPV